jgi:biotin synthase
VVVAGTGALGFDEVRSWLAERDPGRLERLFAAADTLRRERVGDAVHLRGIVEISNHCRRLCHYCGLRAGNRRLGRYRMGLDEVARCAAGIARAGVGTAVLQAGEDPGLTRDTVTEMVRRIKGETGQAVTLSLGERGLDEYEAWLRAGADRVLLRFETSDRALFGSLHPSCAGSYDRIEALCRLRQMGYEIGSGVMFGLPGQTADSLARDLLLMRELDLDMIGCGPYIPHPDTPLGEFCRYTGPPEVPGTLDTAFRMIALCRLLVPRANIPVTTAVATLGGEAARMRALACGANVVMPNFTPPEYRGLYEIYQGKACPPDGAETFCPTMHERLQAIGRTVGRGPGSSKKQ